MQQLPMPVPAEQYDRRFIVSGVPYNPPFVPDVPVPYSMVKMLPMVVGYTISEIQSGLSRGPLRIFLFNMMSANGWNNDIFFTMVKSVADYADYIIGTERLPPETAIGRASAEMCCIMVSRFVMTYPDLMRYCDQRQMDDVKMWCDKSQFISSKINAMEKQMHNPHMQQPQQYPPQHQPHPAYQQPPQAWQQPVPQHQFYQQQAPQTHGYYPPHPMYPPAPQMFAHQQPGMQPQFQQPSMSSPGSMRPRGTYPKQPEVEQVTFGPRGPVVNYGHEEQVFQSQPTQADYAAPVCRQWTSDAPYSIAYSTKTSIAVLTNVDGCVVEEIQWRKPGVKYEDHELNPMFRLKSRDNELDKGPRIAPRWNTLVSVVAPDPEVATPELDGITLEGVTKLYSKEQVTTLAHSLAEAEMIMFQQAKANNETINTDLPYEFRYKHLTPVMTGGGTLFSIVHDMSEMETLPEVAVRLDDIYNAVTKIAWHAINDRLTIALNEALMYNFGLEGYEIESFNTDCSELFNIIQATFGEEIVNKINSYTKVIVTKALGLLSGVAMTSYSQPIEGLVVFSENVSVTRVPWYASQFNVGALAKVALIKEDLLPEISGAVRNIMERVIYDSDEKIDVVYIVTLDNVKIRIHEGFLVADAYLISVEA